jgi:predicted 2-oxoglutarate/Fe(II)-dependent dioxygenase YbiX
MLGMSSTVENSAAPPPRPGRGILPPYNVIRNFLDESLIAGLLDLAVSRETEFRPTEVAGGVNLAVRSSVSVNNLGALGSVLRAKIRELVPELAAELGTPPITNPKIELQLVAHGDGAFFKRHIDTLPEKHRIATGTQEEHRIHVISGVYYFHAQPKGFTGGALRLHAIGDPQTAAFVDIEPVLNSLLVFPSWAPHEVMPVSSPSRRFIDSRFAVNCFVNRERREAA